MRWKLGCYTYCETKRELIKEDGTVTELEPLLAELLSYFCRNPDIVISRNQLMEEVWQSRIITDNAINRVIANLRKALQDDVKSPSFIATFPRKGYKFVAVVEECDEASAQSETTNTLIASKKNSHIFRVLTVVLGLFCIALLSLYILDTDSTDKVPKVVLSEALTRDGEQEVLPSVSPNGRFLAYSKLVNGNLKLFVKDLHSQKIEEVGRQKGGSGPASWSMDSKELVYLNTTDNSCIYYRVILDGLEVVRSEPIHTCPVGSFGKMLFTHDNNRLIYTENTGPNTPYSIYELNLTTSVSKRLPQPELNIQGNFQFDLHPQNNEVLISSPNDRQWLGLYSLDLSTNQLSALFKLNKYACCAIWNHKGDGIILVGEPPSEQLLSYTRNGQQSNVIYQVTHSISHPARFPNGKDYVYSGGIVNRDISAYNLENKRKRIIVNTSVKDQLPSISNDANKIAYVSLESGVQEIWIRNLSTSQSRKLTEFNKKMHFFDIKWSPDDQFIAALSVNEMYLIDIEQERVSKLDMPEQDMRYISFITPTKLSYSVKREDAWVIESYDTNSGEIEQISDFAAVSHARNSEDTLWLDGKGGVFFGMDATKVEGIENLSNKGRNFKLLKQGEHIFYLSNESDGQNLYQHNLSSGLSVMVYSGTDVSNFTYSNGVLFIEEESAFSADIIKITVH
ncbi:winged helix-turn-helix domain-containing protein [Pseudoalteromonas luteoviolacea]|uniref:OmpR/PhoB-type domain-containing protein n=1 Tax=Pseudoalteromonas luteoviolacea DSM 6061 TaxID=1365250 RepID=A0A167CBG1_9GAMM|nr:winged helix-turn-helix domain-containing protein [Pseudoalteromonas luteoviolacea]KZN47462.1 hypothetical protein N475_06185 [Pseudoalteromonas luteoviolacea DSM 6061]MBE0388645.1 cholera toxin transcriptional activator [Pseudoalteromonas luteoviolacea DSM 6061]